MSIKGISDSTDNVWEMPKRTELNRMIMAGNGASFKNLSGVLNICPPSRLFFNCIQ